MRPPCVVRREHRPPRAFGRHSAGRRTRGASASRGGSAAHAARCTPGTSVLAGVPRPMRAFTTRGASALAAHAALAGVPHASRRPRGLGPRGRSAAHAARRPRGASAPRGRSAGRRTRGASALAGIPQASRRPPPHTGPQPSRAFRGPRRTPPTRGLGPRGGSAGLPPPAATHGASALAGVSQAARARSQPAPAARFSRKPPCGIGSRMVYCT